MQDRVPTYPGRVTLTPVAGKANTYDMARADEPTQQGTPLNKATLLKDDTAALYGLGTDAVPNDLFNILSASALYKTIVHTQQIGSLPEGTIIYLNESGSPVPFYVAKQNYEPDHNTNRTLVVRKDAVTQGAWNSSNVNTYNGSTIDTWFNSTYLNTLDSGVRTAIGTTNIPATSPRNSGVIRLEKSVFALSGTELGLTSTGLNTEGTTVPISSMLKIAYNNGTAIVYWTRSPQTSSTSNVFQVVQNGAINPFSSNYALAYYRPAFTLPSTFGAYLNEPTTGLYTVTNDLIMPLPSVQIATGSYVGTGTYGQSNPNSLTFGFKPKFVVVGRTDSSDTSIGFIYGRGEATTTNSDVIRLTWGENFVSWYTTGSGSRNQLNTSGTTYCYLALG